MTKTHTRFVKNLLLVCLLPALTGSLSAQIAWKGLQKLEGTWKQSGKASYEKWTVASDTLLSGEGFKIQDDNSRKITETLQLVLKDDGTIVYRATVPDQNDSAGIDFKLTFFTTSSWTFENPAHDFPTKIEYWLQDAETLRATVSGDNEQSFTLWFNKVPELKQLPQRPRTLQGYDVFISSRNTGTVKRFDAFTGQYKGEFGKEQIGNETQDVAIGPDGMLYVTSLQAKNILKFNPADGTFLGNFSQGYDLEKPTKLSFGADGYVYVSQWGQEQKSVVRFNAQTGAFDKDFTGPLAGPLGHVWDRDGNLYVACFFSQDIRKFGPDGTPAGVVSPKDSLKGPSNIWFHASGDLLVADWDQGSIKRFSPDDSVFRYKSAFATGYARLEGTAIGPDGYLYAIDWYLNLVKKLDADSGRSIGVYLEGGGMQQPNALTFWKVKM
ncbi:MAG: hypothetical protein EP344_16745 [Bacteroidetes bacterium]|nr:MAG: hypothetical protein EP344_16745 [Bacteroidota bacterium]